MKKYKMILETIDFQTGAITQTLTRWAADYDLPVGLVYKRYNAGLRGAELIAPTPRDVIDYNDIKRMWGHKWTYAPHKRKPKKYKENLRWVYVGGKD